jgi:aminoglycoside phosphotransferase (APT) family kinase protein
MEFHHIARKPDAFQRSVTADEVRAMCRRAFGDDVPVASVVELGLGTYNSTYRVEIAAETPVILRVAPEPAKQFRSEREFLRNEYATLPYLAPLGPLVPRTLAVDFTYEIVGRDYLFQTMLDGVPAPEGLGSYPRAEWASFFRELGTITRRIHDVRGTHFGWVSGPTFATWGAAVVAYLEDIAADLADVGVDATDVHHATEVARRERAILDEITEPRLLHGDLWTANVMVDPRADVPTVTGVLDGDRACWGDPAADWTIHRAGRRPGTERDAFWETYGSPMATPAATTRSLLYRARHVGSSRLERHRLGNLEELPETYDDLRAVLDRLG